MDKLHIKALVQKEKGRLLAVASEEVTDREGDIIKMSGWKLDNFKQNPVLLWYHNIKERSLPIGKVKNLKKKTIDGVKKLVFEPVFEEITEFGRTVKAMVEAGFLNTVSVGFIPLEREKNTITKAELLEVSFVPVPALPSAQIISRAKEMGLDGVMVKAAMGDKEAMEKVDIEDDIVGESKAVVPYSGYDPAPEGRAWDAGAAKRRIKQWAGDDWGKYKKAFAWYDASDPEKVASYKLPHHDMQGGSLITVWRGVAAAMAALLGARGGTDIPEGDRRGVYNHLKKHYGQFDKEIPDFRLVEGQVLKGLDEEIKAVTNDYEAERLIKTLRKIKDEVKETRRAVKKPERLTNRDLLKFMSLAIKNLNRKEVKDKHGRRRNKETNSG